MKIEKSNPPSSVLLERRDPIIADLETALPVFLGRGKCNATGCRCPAYNSDSTNSGTCTCGHTAADHAF